MKITYDADADALSIVFAETTVTTQHLADGIAAEYDAAGCLAGLEILDVRSRLGGADTFRRIILEGVGSVVPGAGDPPPLKNQRENTGNTKKGAASRFQMNNIAEHTYMA